MHQFEGRAQLFEGWQHVDQVVPRGFQAMFIRKGTRFTQLIPCPPAFLKLGLKDAFLAAGQIDAVFVCLAHRFSIAQAYINSKHVRMFLAERGGANASTYSTRCAAVRLIPPLKLWVF